MSKNSTRYTEEFKQQIIDLHRSVITVTSLSREYGVSTVTIYKWLNDLLPVEISSEESVLQRNSKL